MNETLPSISWAIEDPNSFRRLRYYIAVINGLFGPKNGLFVILKINKKIGYSFCHQKWNKLGIIYKLLGILKIEDKLLLLEPKMTFFGPILAQTRPFRGPKKAQKGHFQILTSKWIKLEV